MIHHCSIVNVGVGGGIETYIASLLNAQSSSVSRVVFKSIHNIDQGQFDLLHLHDIGLIEQLSGECPSVFTAHNHSLYCPSGTKYIKDNELPCTINYNDFHCAWNHCINGCGSRRPYRILAGLHTTRNCLQIQRNLSLPIIANSNYVRDQLINNRVNPVQVETLHCGVKPNSISQPLTVEIHKEQKILFAGRIVPDKGLDWLIHALKFTPASIHLNIAGDGWYRPQVIKLINQLGLSQRVTWHGWCNEHKLNALYQESFAVVFPSVWPEPAGLISLEAYAHYRPIIASCIGGIPEYVIDGQTGILTAVNNIKVLSEAICLLSQNFSLAKQMGQAGHDLLIKNFTMELHVKKLENIYERVVTHFHGYKLTSNK